MSFIPPGEKIIEQKICRLSGQEFFVTDKDLEFYDKISPVFGGKKYSIPTPTLCPDERQRRRLTFRNERKLYNRKCDKTGQQIISIYSPDTSYKVYDQKVWWSDTWSPLEYGKKFDFDRGFFEQFGELLIQVPLMNLYNIFSENSEYSNYAGYNKNCYLVFNSLKNENCLYGKGMTKNINCLDQYFTAGCECSYELVDCYKCYEVYFSKNCEGCRESAYLRNCRNCHHCFGCFSQSNREYMIFDEFVGQEEYASKLDAVCKIFTPEQIYQKFQSRHIIERENANINSENCLGDYLSHCRDCFSTFEANTCENCRYSDSIKFGKNSYDTIGNNIDAEFLYECLATGKGSNVLFSVGNENSSFGYYGWYNQGAHDIFGCISLHNHEHHCILNTPYSVHEYETLCAKIADHMQSLGEWGEFFPHELSPFGYNETVAQEYFPMTEEGVKENGWKWYDGKSKNTYIGNHYTPLSISQYDERVVGYNTSKKNIDEVLGGIILCSETKKPFKIIKQELVFYIENSIPIPTKHPDQRHKERMHLRNPRKLCERTCAECQKEIITTYSGDRPEKVFCEQCYRKLVY